MAFNFGTAKQILKEATTTATDIAQGVSRGLDIVTSQPSRFLGSALLGKETFNEGDFTDDQLAYMRTLVHDTVGRGKTSFDYKDYRTKNGDLSANANINNIDLTNPQESVKYIIGAGNIARDDSGNVYVVDEYDFNKSPTGKRLSKGDGLANLPFMDKVATILEAYNNDSIGLYGVARMVGEAFLPEGEGASVRVKLGHASDLGISDEDLEGIELVDAYESKKEKVHRRILADRRKASGLVSGRQKPVIAVTGRGVSVDTTTVFKRYGVVGGPSTEQALKKAVPDFSFAKYKIVGETGEEYGDGTKIPKGITISIQKRS